ncbi:gamma-mobile-trio integrase GmtZ [Vibrio sp. TRT 17S01]|uniref:gamma-mobile-trio integrase GmtZ n=1 Tax=Vibrio sp. TRT 17S01 TaxID=3418505 RepID=UPI003CE994D9
MKNKTKKYSTYFKASEAAQLLGIKTSKEYVLLYKKDPRLPSTPSRYYSTNWKGWELFLGNYELEKYKTIEEASKAALDLHLYTEMEYKYFYVEDHQLPKNPDIYYKSNWVSWDVFLKINKYTRYGRLSSAKMACSVLSIRNYVDYKKNRDKDRYLPVYPNYVYDEEWNGWFEFFRSKRDLDVYHNIDSAARASIALGIDSSASYLALSAKDPMLPRDPSMTYSHEWQSWYHFLNKTIPYYKTLEELKLVVKKLNIKSKEEYAEFRKHNVNMPNSPEKVYINEWLGWDDLLGCGEIKIYESIQDASKASVLLGIKTIRDYSRLYREDPKLPDKPEQEYAENWKNWYQFLNQVKHESYQTLDEVKCAVQRLGITTIEEYRVRFREDPLLPKEIEIIYPKIKIYWPNIQGKSDFYKYDELSELVRKEGVSTLRQYSKFRIESKDPRIPVKPEEYYKGKGWTNVYDFWGTKRPYQVKYFTKEWSLWSEKIEEFLKSARGGDTKAKDLCEFVREYIEPNGFDVCPLEFLTRGSTNIQPMLNLFEQVPVTRKKKWLFSINEFLDWTISNYLILEDADTGEITHIKGAKNPFSHINFNGQVETRVVNETNKLALPYQYVKAGREWIFPSNSIDNNLNYRDLAHLHCFSSDWLLVDDTSIIDTSDPDCVFKNENGKIYLWFPAYWTYTYSLMQLPARGMQIVYCDSGEADKELADFQSGKVVWKKNRAKLAGLTNRQSMVSKSGQGEFGVHYTSNKTKFDGSGYTIPFMPIDLAYWLVKLRKWQQKYNPIELPTRWLDCARTNLNEAQRKQKGSNCFLFRDYLEKEPGTFGGRLTTRLATALFFSAKSDITTATYRGLKYNQSIKELENSQTIALSHFKSPYTPHSMRVSLINAYAYEFGIPLEVIMKLVGHSSIIMTIYYTKSGKAGANLREKMEVGEKEAMSKATQTLKSFVEQQRIEEVKSQLVGSSMDLLNSLDNARPASSYLWKDFGICPVGGAFCSEGGCPVATKANIYHPVPAGYLGEQNCFQCRFFITGPAFLVGLAAMFNEISLAVNTQSIRYTSLGRKLDDIAEKIDVIDHQLYKIKVDSSEKSALESDRRELVGERMHLNSEIETRAKKLDLYLSDMNAIHRHIHNCQTLMRNPKENTENHYQLIVPPEFTLGVELDEVSNFRQLSEVCSNAELYHSCSDDLAVTRRSQMIDKMMVKNGIQPQFFLLSEEEQLVAGNQLIELMLTRLKGWEDIDRLMDGSLTLKDLSIDNQFDEKTIRELFEKSKPLKRIG